MKLARAGLSGSYATSILAAALAIAGCSSDSDGPDTGPTPWSFSKLGGPPAAVSEIVTNHESLAVVEEDLLLGTGDGVWRRPLDGTGKWERAGLDGKAIHALVTTSDGKRLVAAGYDPQDETAPTAWYSTDEAASWTPAADWPRRGPGIPPTAEVFPFFSLEADPAEGGVIYGGLSGDTVAVTVDGGATWLITDGATEPSMGDHCVNYRPADSMVLIQGCEAPLDIAWVAARSVIEDDRFQLPEFRYFYGYPDLTELSNRRINAIVPSAASDQSILVGVEGGLVELTSKSGEWTGRSDITPRWIFRSDEDKTDLPYAYIRAIATLDAAGTQLLFGGMVNGESSKLPLFETRDGGSTVELVSAPGGLKDPRVEQAVKLSTKEVLLLISQDGGEEGRTLEVYGLQRR